MKRALVFLLLAGCGGGTGEVVSASPLVLLGRSAQVTITGKGTHFTNDSKVDLGLGIMITQATATSSTILQVMVDVANDAPIGAHDVRVDDAKGAAAALPVASPATLTYAGTPQRGAIVTAKFVSVDPDHSFAETGFGVTIDFLASPGVHCEFIGATTDLVAHVAFDESAPLGPVDLDVVFGDTHFPIPGAFVVTDGSGPTLDASTKITVTDGAAFAWIDPLTPLAWVRVDATTAMNTPSLFLLDTMGDYDTLEGTSVIDAVIDDPRGLAIYDPAGASYDVTLSLNRTALTAATLASGNNSVATASPLGGPDVYVANATLTNAPQYFSVDLGAGAIGSRLNVQTRAGDPLTDTHITVIRDDQTSLLGPPSSDTGDLDSLVTPTIPTSGRHFIRIDPGSAFDPAHTSFALLVTIEP